MQRHGYRTLAAVRAELATPGTMAAGALEVAGLAVGAPKLQGLLDRPDVNALQRSGQQIAGAALQSGTRFLTSALAPVLSRTIQGVTEVLAMVERTLPEPTPEPVIRVAMLDTSNLLEDSRLLVNSHECRIVAMHEARIAVIHGAREAARQAARCEARRAKLRVERLRYLGQAL